MKHHPYSLAVACGLVLCTLALAADDPKQAAPRDPSVGKSYRVPYVMTQTNHFLVRVRINGKGPFNFLVDTGAPALFISTHAAKSAGLVENQEEFWTDVKQFDFEGGARLTDIKGRIEDPFQLIGMNALGLPGTTIDGILGFTILAKFRIEIDPTQDRMTWTRLDFNPKEPWVPRKAIRGQAPAELQMMNMLGPLAKGAALLLGKQEPDKLIPRGGLGMMLEESSGTVKVAKVLDESPAAKAGVKSGDTIKQIQLVPNKRPARPAVPKIDSVKSAHLAGDDVRPGDKVRLSILRGSETLDIIVIAGEGF